MASTEPTSRATTTSPPPPSVLTEQEKQPSNQDPQEQNQQQENRTLPPRPRRPRKPIHTHHCRFCSHLLLATTRDLSQLHRRRDPAQDRAFILPVSSSTGRSSSDVEESDSESEPEPDTNNDEKNKTKKSRETDYTILLSTLLPDRKHTIIRRTDGFEKRLLLRCGRCRVVIGYFLDDGHFKREKDQGIGGAGAEAGEIKKDGEGEEEGEKAENEAKVVYLLPGALVKTEELDVDAEDVEVKLESDREWRGWLKGER